MLRVVLQGRHCLHPASFTSARPLVVSLKFLHTSYACHTSALEEMKEKERAIRPEPLPPKMKMEPFVKNLFRGKIDPHIFAFPELDQGALEIVDDMKLEMEKFLNAENISTFSPGPRISSEFIEKLKQVGIFKANIPKQYGGLELSCTEMIALAEVYAKDLSLFHTLNTHVHYISSLFSNFASEELKEKFLPSLASGDLQIGFALWEENAGVDVSKLNCTADFFGSSFILTGKKKWVCNGGIADKFIVFAAEEKNPIGGVPDVVTCFLVDKHAEGVSARSMDTLGVNGYNAWEVTFDKTVVPMENIIGVQGEGLSILRSLINGKLTLTGAYAGLLRDLLNATVHHAINKETFGKPLIEYHIVQQHLAEAATRIYALESISFMTADLYDNVEDPDIEVETAIVKLHSSETLLFVLQKCMAVLGSDAYLKDKPYERILRDALFSPMVESSADSLRMTIALHCLSHVGKNFQEHVIERRNPLFYPAKALKYMYTKQMKFFDIDPDYKAVVHEHCHPSLETPAELLEKAVILLGRCTEETLVRWGKDIDDQQMNLARLADIAVDLYVSAAVLARSSRAHQAVLGSLAD